MNRRPRLTTLAHPHTVHKEQGTYSLGMSLTRGGGGAGGTVAGLQAMAPSTVAVT